MNAHAHILGLHCRVTGVATGQGGDRELRTREGLHRPDDQGYVYALFDLTVAQPLLANSENLTLVVLLVFARFPSPSESSSYLDLLVSVCAL